MKVKVSNLGAIGEGTIDLSKKINLLCGQNGTGKTYFSYVIYGLLRNKLHIKGDGVIADNLIDERSITIDIDFPALLSYKKEMLKNTKEEIDTIFGIGVDVVEKLFSEFTIEDIEDGDDFKQRIISASIVNKAKVQGIGVALSKKENEAKITLTITDESIPSDAIQGFRLLLNSFIFYTLAVYPISGVDVFPVERNSIYTFSKELSIRKQEAMDNLQLLVDKEKKISKFDIFFNSKRYPLPVKDGLMVAEDLAEVKKTKSEFYEFAEDLEVELLHGKVQISNDGEIQFRPDKSSRTLLPIQMTASIIKTLSSLVVYLKHIANYNDLIIIDEPEINLHPSNQIIIARLLARLANKGFRLLISTHSDYIVREFNNLVILSQKDNASVNNVAKEYEYKEDEYIRIEDLSVYSFVYKNKRSKQIVVNEIPIDETGFEVKTMDEVIDKQNNISETLYYSLKYGEVK